MIVVSGVFTSILSIARPFSKPTVICNAYQMAYFSLITFLAHESRSSGCKICIILFGTSDMKMLWSFSRSWTTLVIWPQNISIPERAGKLNDSFNFHLTDLMHGKIISLIIFYVSFSLLWCFGLALSEKPFGKSTVGKLLSVLFPWISCIGWKFPTKSMINVAVIARLPLEIYLQIFPWLIRNIGYTLKEFDPSLKQADEGCCGFRFCYSIV